MFLLLLATFIFNTHAIEENRTDLGPTGNAYVAHRFEQYLQSPRVCKTPHRNARRVILTGFGPFSGAKMNFSSDLLASWGAFSPLSNIESVTGTTRTFKSHSGEIQICMLSLSTMWDLAAAIIIKEAESFSPDLILMSGMGGSHSLVLETIAANHTTTMNGYSSEGEILSSTTPIAKPIIPNEDISHTIPMNWNAGHIKTTTEQNLLVIGYSISIDTPTTPSDDYVCNNTRYVVAYAALNNTVTLAGGEVVLTPQLRKTPRVGFIHYPYSVKATTEPLNEWAEFLFSFIEATL